MKTRIFNAIILSGNELVKGELHIENDRITYIGDGEDCDCVDTAQNAERDCNLCDKQATFGKNSWDKEINANGNLVAPSFKNAHAHSPMTFLRSYADDLPLQSWLFEKVFPNEAKLTDDDCYWLTRLSVLEYLSSGMSVASDMYFHLDAIADACIDSGFRNVILEGISESNKVGLVERLDNGKKNLDKKGGLVEYRLGLHAEYTNSLDNIKAIVEYSKLNKMPLFTHISETKKEVEECRGRYGVTPIELIDSLGGWDNGGTVYHCVHPNDEDLKILASKKVAVVTCPSSNLKLASGIAPICKMLDLGINVAVGTDGAASNNAQDMFREMFLATALQKVALGMADALPANVVLDMATKNGALAMNLEDLDCLAVGKIADLVVIDLAQPNMQPIHNIVKNIV
ncbi:MAG: amidohydrolase, partial [Clostridia bacterium]